MAVIGTTAVRDGPTIGREKGQKERFPITNLEVPQQFNTQVSTEVSSGGVKPQPGWQGQPRCQPKGRGGFAQKISVSLWETERNKLLYAKTTADQEQGLIFSGA